MARIVDKAAKRQALIEAAAGVFAKHGFQAASMADVARHAGVAKGSLYDYFSCKDELFYAVFEKYSRSMLEDAASLFPPRESVIVQIDLLLTHLFQRLKADSALYPLTLEFWAATGSGAQRERFSEAMEGLYQGWRSLLSALLSAGVTAGEFRADLDTDNTAALMVASVDGLFLQYWLNPELPLDCLRKALISQWLHGLT